jgi:hypothetical protein
MAMEEATPGRDRPHLAPSRGPFIEDWALLKYGWLAVFLVHVAFLAIGVWQIRAALEMWDPKFLEVEQRRIDHVIQAVYMVTIAFSIILLILAVFVLEIFRTQHRLLHRLEQNERRLAERGGPEPLAPGPAGAAGTAVTAGSTDPPAPPAASG